MATTSDNAPTQGQAQGSTPTEVPAPPVPRRSLRTYLAYLSGALIILPALISGAVLGLGARQAIRAETFRHLQDVCDAKAGEIEANLEAWMSAVNRFSHRPLLRQGVEALTDPNTSSTRRRYYQELLDWMMYDLALSMDTLLGDALVLRLDGEPLAWTGLRTVQQARLAAAQQPVSDIRQNRRARPGRAYLDPVTQQVVISVTKVIYERSDDTGRQLGLLVLRLYAPRVLYPGLQDVPYLGASAEVQLLDGQRRLLNELRQKPGYLMQQTPGPLAQALAAQASSGVVSGLDYRGVSALAAATPVAYTDWTLVYKVDRAEALAGLNRVTTVWTLLMLLVVGGGLWLARFTARRISDPVLRVGGAARRIAEGDLAARVSMPGREDEFALLAHDFNYMAERMTVSQQELETQVKARTAELVATNERLTRLNEELTAFTYTVSHDLSSPLVSLQGMAGMLLRDYGDKLDDEGKRRLGRLQANVQMMEALVSDLLELSRIGRVTGRIGDFSMRSLAMPVLDSLRESLLEAQAEVDLPEHDCTVHGDLNRLQQVLTNLLSNAIKHRSKERPLHLRLDCQSEGEGWVRVSIADNGPGIPPDFLERIFLPFQRLPASRSVPGTGMGLTIVRKIIEHHGGKVWMESELGAGTTVHLTLPKAGNNHAARDASNPVG